MLNNRCDCAQDGELDHDFSGLMNVVSFKVIKAELNPQFQPFTEKDPFTFVVVDFFTFETTERRALNWLLRYKLLAELL